MRGKLLLSLVALCCIGLGAAAAQICRDDIAATAPDSRFQNNGNGTVTDLATGLIWKQCVEGLSGSDCGTGSPSVFLWEQALQHAADQVFAGSALWRLPNKNELASLVERRCHSPATNTTFFPKTPSSRILSSSQGPAWQGNVWVVSFGDGGLGESYKNLQEYVRLVRAGQ